MNLRSIRPLIAEICCYEESTNQITVFHQVSKKQVMYVMCPESVSLHTEFQKSSFNTWFLMNFFVFDQSDRSIMSHVSRSGMKHLKCLLLLATNAHDKFGNCRIHSREENRCKPCFTESKNIDQSNRSISSNHQNTFNVCYVPRVC